MSGDAENEYFSDGVSEEILNVLARTPDLRVAARTSSFAFKGQAKEIPDIARELEVRMVLEGSVRKQADRVRITAQLIDAEKGFHLWSQTYDRELKDIFAIQDEIAQAIARELDVKLGGARTDGAAPADTPDLEAYDLYLKGLALWQARGEPNLREADRLFRAALAIDPDMARAWAGLALTYAILPEWSAETTAASYPVARDAAEHAFAIDPDLPEPHAVLGYVAYAEFRFATGRAMFERALALAPSFATGYQWFGESLAIDGDYAGALPILRKAVALDPKAPVVRNGYAYTLFNSGADDEAMAVCETILADAPDWTGCRLLRFDHALLRKDPMGARAELQRMAARRGPEAVAFADAMMDPLDGTGDADAVAARLAAMPDGFKDPGSPTPLGAPDAMHWFMAIGRNDLALERFARYARELPHLARIFAFDVHYESLRCEPGFQDTLLALKVEPARAAKLCAEGG
jgi:TolB-like protein/Tfp pilus assembly protein PilF